MHLSEEHILEFIDLYEKISGERLCFQEAKQKATNDINFFFELYGSHIRLVLS